LGSTDGTGVVHSEFESLTTDLLKNIILPEDRACLGSLTGTAFSVSIL